MKKSALFLCLVCLAAHCADAGILDGLLLPKKSEPLPRISEKDWERIQQQLGQEVQDPALCARVARVVDRLRPHMRHPKIAAAIQPHVLGNDQVNAFALPDGTIVVLTGLLEAVGDDDEMLAQVIGHEMGHVDCQHSRPSNAELLLQIVKVVLGDKGEYGDLVFALFASKTSQDDEYEADLFGLRYMMLAGCSPNGALRQQREFLTRFGTGVGLGQYFSTHPPNSERLRALQRNVGQALLECGQHIPVTWCPTTRIASPGPTCPGDLCADLCEAMNSSRQMTAAVMKGVGDLPEALAACREASADLLIWVDAPKPAKRAKAGFRLEVYDVPSGVLILQLGSDAHGGDAAGQVQEGGGASGDRELLERYADAKEKERGRVLALMLLSNRIWQCGGATPASARDTDPTAVGETPSG